MGKATRVSVWRGRPGVDGGRPACVRTDAAGGRAAPGWLSPAVARLHRGHEHRPDRCRQRRAWAAARRLAGLGLRRRYGMAHEEIDGVPIWYEERGDPAGPPLVALHGGILTFLGSFGDVLPWLTEGRRVIGVELQGHGHTPDTGRGMSIERFADDVAELVDRVAGGGPADLWGFSLGALTATGVAVRHPSTVRRLVLAAVNIRPDGYHPEITAPEQDDPRLPTEQEFAAWRDAYEAVAPDPDNFL